MTTDCCIYQQIENARNSLTARPIQTTTLRGCPKYRPSTELDTSGLSLLLLTIIGFSDRDVVQIFYPGAEADGVATKEAFVDPLIAKPNGMLNLCVGAIGYHIDGIPFGSVALESSAIRACFVLYNVFQNSNDQPKMC